MLYILVYYRIKELCIKLVIKTSFTEALYMDARLNASAVLKGFVKQGTS
jgi:hypothetical protein